MVEVYLFAAAVLSAGVLWYRVVRPMLEAAGVITDEPVVRTSERAAPIVTSRDEPAPAQNTPSSLQTDAPQTPDRPMIPKPTPAQMLDIFKAARAAGVKRDALAPAIRAAGLPFDNNLWAQAAPPPPELDEDDAYETPIAGRTTGATFRDPLLDYQPPPR